MKNNEATESSKYIAIQWPIVVADTSFMPRTP
jgi:hypothetical protein